MSPRESAHDKGRRYLVEGRLVVTLGSEGDAKLSLEVPGSELAQMMALASMLQRPLRVTVEVDE